MINAADYLISDANHASGRVTICGRGVERRLSIAELKIAAEQSDHDLRALYAALYRRALAAVETARDESVAACSGHRPLPWLTADYGFSGAVAQPENRAAHGNICQRETCRCGAVRRTNVNGAHTETTGWL